MHHEALQAHARVHGGGGEEDGHGGQDGAGEGGGNPHALIHERAAALYEGLHAAGIPFGVDLFPLLQGLKARGGGDDGAQREQALAHGAEVPHKAHVSFLIHLLGRGAGGHHAVEAGNSAAGDGDKEQRENARGAVRYVVAQCRCGQRRAGNEEGSVQDG